MDFIQVIALAALQGFTEFLPISSSGHLVLLPHWLGWQDQGLAFDVAVHFGSLLAVVLYFRTDLQQMLSHSVAAVRGRGVTALARLAAWVILATVPVCVVGLLWGDAIETALRTPQAVGTASIAFGLLLALADKLGSRLQTLAAMTSNKALCIGFAQAIAILPGVSRSGMTIIAGLALGFNREAATRFSFLMSIPVIVLAGGLKTLALWQSDVSVQWSALLLGMAVSALVAYACIHWFLQYIKRFPLWPFSVYLIVLGTATLIYFKGA